MWLYFPGWLTNLDGMSIFVDSCLYKFKKKLYDVWGWIKSRYTSLIFAYKKEKNRIQNSQSSERIVTQQNLEMLFNATINNKDLWSEFTVVTSNYRASTQKYTQCFTSLSLPMYSSNVYLYSLLLLSTFTALEYCRENGNLRWLIIQNVIIHYSAASVNVV